MPNAGVTPLAMAAALFIPWLPPAQAGARDLTAKISPEGLAFVAAEAPRLIPSSFSFANTSSTLIDCPSIAGGDTVATTSNGKATLKVSSLSITPGSGTLSASLVASGSGGVDVSISRPYACMGSALKCHVSFTVTSATAKTTLQPQVSASKLKIGNPTVTLGLTKSNVDIKVSECGFAATLANLVLGFLEGWVVSQAKSKLESIAKTEIPPVIEKSLAGFTEYSGTLQGFTLEASLGSLTTSSTGLTAGLDADMKATTQPACKLGTAPVIGSASSAPSILWKGEHAAVALARETVARALKEAWSGGYFCLTDAQLKAIGLPQAGPSLMGALLGMSGVDATSLAIPECPSVSFVPGADLGLKLKLPTVLLMLEGKNGLQQPTVVTISMSLDVHAELRLDPISRAVRLEVKQLALSNTAIEATNAAGLNLDVNVVETLVKTVVLPLVTEQLSSFKLLPTILHKNGGAFDSYYLYLARSAATSSHTTLWVTVYRKPDSDSTAPDTMLVGKPVGRVVPQLFRFIADGSDDKTPSALLRYQWKINGGAWTSPGFDRDRAVQLTQGQYTVAVRAVDLNGNQDSSPAQTSFTVDEEAPPSAGDGQPGGNTEPLPPDAPDPVAIGEASGESGITSEGGCSLGPAGLAAGQGGLPVAVLLLAAGLALRRRRAR